MTTSEIAAQLAATADVDAARTTLATLKGAQLRDVAAHLGIHLFGTVTKQRRQLLYWGVERRLESAAISGIR